MTHPFFVYERLSHSLYSAIINNVFNHLRLKIKR